MSFMMTLHMTEILTYTDHCLVEIVALEEGEEGLIIPGHPIITMVNMSFKHT